MNYSKTLKQEPRQFAGDPLNRTTLANALYKFNQRTTVSLAVNNLFNRIKHDDSGGWPYYPVGNYSPAGRQLWLELLRRMRLAPVRRHVARLD